nr:transmembrane protein 8B isoform X1 [Caretta caretta]
MAAGGCGDGAGPGSAARGMARRLLLLLLLGAGPLADGLFVTDYFTRTPRKLSPFRSFASIELFHFRIPEDTLVAVWNLITFKEQGGTFGDRCPDRSVTVYFRSGAPPIIAPLHTHFPRDTAVPGSFTLTLTWSLPNRTTGVFNITSPLPGDWFLAAHLPKDEGKISVKGLYEECQYLFQPQLVVQRLVGIAVLYPGYISAQSIAPHNRSSLYKVFVPSHTSRVLVQVLGCRAGDRSAASCPLWLKVRAKAPPLHNSTALDCRERAPCQLALERPLWHHWYYVLLEKALGVPGPIRFQLTVQLTDCSRPGLSRAPVLLPAAAMNMPQSFGALVSLSLGESLPPAVPKGTQPPPAGPPPGECCWPIRPTLRNELDTFSVHFYIFFGPNVSVPPNRPAVFGISLLPVLDSGGVLNLELKLNVSSLRGENVTVFGCLTHEVPLMAGDNASVTCETGSLAGFLLSVNSTASLARLRIPYPQTGSWYLSLRSLCATEHGFEPCANVTAEVYLRTYLSPCIEDCGPYGQCKLLSTNNYLYAACECKAAPGHAASVPQQPDVPAARGHRPAEPLPARGLGLRLHHVLLHLLSRLRPAGHRRVLHHGVRRAAVLRLPGLPYVRLGHRHRHGAAPAPRQAGAVPAGRHAALHGPAAGPPRALEPPRAQSLRRGDHGYRLDGAQHPPASLLPPHVAALGLLPGPGRADRGGRRAALRLRGDGGELLLHPQHLAHADRRQRGLPAAPAPQGRRAPGPPAPPQGLRLPALRQRAGGAGAGGPRHGLRQQRLCQLTAPGPLAFAGTTLGAWDRAAPGRWTHSEGASPPTAIVTSLRGGPEPCGTPGWSLPAAAPRTGSALRSR